MQVVSDKRRVWTSELSKILLDSRRRYESPSWPDLCIDSLPAEAVASPSVKKTLSIATHHNAGLPEDRGQPCCSRAATTNRRPESQSLHQTGQGQAGSSRKFPPPTRLNADEASSLSLADEVKACISYGISRQCLRSYNDYPVQGSELKWLHMHQSVSIAPCSHTERR